MHCHPECNQFRPWRCSYVRKIMSQECPHNVELSCVFSPIFNDACFFYKACQKGATPNRCFFLGWRVIPSPDFMGKSQVLRTCCQDVLKQINTHIIAAAKENEVLKDQVGSPVGANEDYFAENFWLPSPKTGPENLEKQTKKKPPKTGFRPGKPGGNISMLNCVEVFCSQTTHLRHRGMNGSMSKLATLSTSALCLLCWQRLFLEDGPSSAFRCDGGRVRHCGAPVAEPVLLGSQGSASKRGGASSGDCSCTARD